MCTLDVYTHTIFLVRVSRVYVCVCVRVFVCVIVCFGCHCCVSWGRVSWEMCVRACVWMCVCVPGFWKGGSQLAKFSESASMCVCDLPPPSSIHIIVQKTQNFEFILFLLFFFKCFVWSRSKCWRRWAEQRNHIKNIVNPSLHSDYIETNVWNIFCPRNLPHSSTSTFTGCCRCC